MGEVFISYRTRDNPLGVDGIRDGLESRLPGVNIFLDNNTVRPGEQWAEMIRAALLAADVVVVVMGPEWLTLVTADGQRMLDRDEDWVRWEIRAALEKQIPMLPVLLQDLSEPTRLPEPEDLPEDIRGLLAYLFFEFHRLNYAEDLNRLAERLVGLAPGLVPPAEPGLPARATNGSPVAHNGHAVHGEEWPQAVIGRLVGNGVEFPRSGVLDLASALEAVPCLADEYSRTELVRGLRRSIASNVPHNQRLRMFLVGLVRTCLDYDGGLAELIGLVAEHERPDSLPVRKVIDTIDRWMPAE